jgi:hypothetical protein
MGVWDRSARRAAVSRQERLDRIDTDIMLVENFR